MIRNALVFMAISDTLQCTLTGATMTDSELIAILSDHRRELRADMKDAVNRVEDGLQREITQVKDDLKEDNSEVKDELKSDINGVRIDVHEVKLELTKKDGVLDRLSSLEENSREQTPVSIVHTRAKKTTKERVMDGGATAGVVTVIMAAIELAKSYMASK